MKRIHWLVFLSILGLSILSFSFSFITPIFFKVLIDNIFINKQLYFLNTVIIGMICIFIISSITSYFNNYLMGKLEYKLYKEISEKLFYIIQASSMKNKWSNDTGDLLIRVIGNVQIATKIVSRILPQIVTSLFTIIFPFIIMSYLNLYLALVTISPCVLFIFLNLYLGKKIELNQKKVLTIYGAIFALLKELFSIIPVIKAYNLNNWACEKLENINNDYYSNSMIFTKISSVNASLNNLFSAVPVILFIVIGGRMVIDGSLTIGTFTAFLSYISMFFTPISQISSYWALYKSSTPAIDRINEVMDMEIEKREGGNLNIQEGEIVFKDVEFAYNQNIILKNFNVHFKKGLNYIIGENGAGKSTIIQLICGLYLPNKGEIMIDNQNISEIRQKNLFENISVVFSNPYLFSGSIYENIIIGNLGANKNDVVDVCKLVELESFIEKQQEGYEYNIGESGQLLSSGERQKIALARALIKKSPILLLDEATKSINEETRKSMNKTLNKIKNQRTIVVVTHNLAEIETDSNIIKL